MSIFDQAAWHVDAKEGDAIVVHGAIHPSDGSVIDANATSGGASSVDGGGFFDFEAGGFHVVSYDAATHTVHAIATGGANRCASYGVAGPCLPLRTVTLARTRLETVAQFEASFHDAATIAIEAPTPAPAAAIATTHARQNPIAAALLFGVPALVVLIAIAVAVVSETRRSARARLLAHIKRLAKKAATSRSPIGATVASAVEAARRAVREKKVDPRSPAGAALQQSLRALEHRLDHAAIDARAKEEADATRAIVEEIEIATRAGEEAARMIA